MRQHPGPRRGRQAADTALGTRRGARGGATALAPERTRRIATRAEGAGKRGNRRFPRYVSSWTVPSSMRSSRSSSRTSASPRSPTRCRRARASPRRRCRSCSRRCTSGSARALVCLLPEDADARDAAEAAAWFLGDEHVGFLPSRGVRWESGLEPPPHLVGERARALDVLARGGLVCASAHALAEPLPPLAARPEPLELRAGRELGVEALAESLALAGYERVERVDDRGQFAVRGGLVDVFPTTGREPLRIELFGDEIESIRAFSPFTQRALHPVDEAVVYPAAERRLDLAEEWHGDEGETRPVPDDLVPPLERAPDLVFQPDEVRRVWAEDGLDRSRSTARPSSTRSRRGSRSRSRRSGRRSPRAASPRPRTSCAALVRAGQRVVVAFPHRGEARRTQNLLRRSTRACSSRATRSPTSRSPLRRLAGAPRLRLARPRARAPARPPGLPPPRAARAPARRSRARSFADLRTGDYVVHEDHGVGSCSASRRRRSPASRATTSCSASAATTASTSRTSRSARSPATSAPTRSAPTLSKLGGKAWQR